MVIVACNCHGHSDHCYFDKEVAERKESLDIHGNYDGGGVCINCQHNTDDNNCEKCKYGYFRPEGIPVNSLWACQREYCISNRRSIQEIPLKVWLF